MVVLTNCSKWSFGEKGLDLDFNTSVMNFSMEKSASRESFIISDNDMKHISVYFNLLVRGTFAFFGLANNIVNMIIFSKLGIKDSNSISLMTLSFTDFIFNLLTLFGTICYTWDRFYPNSPINPIDFYYVAFGWWKDVFYLISVWVTTLLSVERCVCVVWPFKVKQIFTKTRSIIAMVIIYAVNIGLHMPVFLTQWLAWSVIECREDNGAVILTKKMILHTSNNRRDIQMYIDIANGAVLPFPSQIIIIISVIWMTYGLITTSKVRNKAKPQDNDDKDNSEKSSETSNLSSKEKRLVKTVLVLAIIVTVCNIPRFIAVYAKQIFEQVDIGKSHRNLYIFLWNLAAFTGVINSSMNIFVYFTINTNYRNTFYTMLGITKDI